MQVTETTNEGLKRAYKIIVPAADIEEKIIARLTEIAATIRMPGFRLGKVPVNLLRKQHGQAIMGEILEATVGESSQKTIMDNDLHPACNETIGPVKSNGPDHSYHCCRVDA